MSLKPIRNHYTEQPPIYEIVMIQYTNKKAVSSGREGRQLFLWDEKREGYFETEEPEWWP